MKIAIVTGGTGGHIYPALSLAEALIKDDSTNSIFFIGNEDRMEAIEIPKYGFLFYGLPSKGFNGGLTEKFKALSALFKSRKLAKEILIKEKPDVVIGFGGYVTVPVIMMAHSLGIWTMIHEQNSVVGKANKVLMRRVDAIVASYEQNLTVFPKSKTRLLGNPRTYALKYKNHQSQLVNYGFKSNTQTLLIVMGSLGSESINAFMKSALLELQNHKIQIVYATGKKHYNEFNKGNPFKSNVRIEPYINQIDLMYEVDLMITRGGATTAAEIAVIGCPSIIIPSPYVPNNHQYYNAKALVDHQACLLIEEKDLELKSFCTTVLETLNDKEGLKQMSMNAKSIAMPNAAEDMIQWIKNRNYD